MKMTKRAICLLLAAVMALALTIPVIAAEDTGGSTRTITLYAGEGKFSADKGGGEVYTVTVTDEGKLPELPTPERKNWTFVGWYKEKPVETTETISIATDTYTKGDYAYSRKVYTAVADSGPVPQDSSAEGITELYALYTTSAHVQFKLNANGWHNRFNAATLTREADVLFDGVVFNLIYDPKTEQPDWNGYTFDGWWTQPNGGVEIKEREDIVGDLVARSDLTTDGHGVPVLYAHWHETAHPENDQSTASHDYDVSKEATNLGFPFGTKSPLRVHANDTLRVTISTTPGNASLRGITWSSSDSSIVDVESYEQSGRIAILSAGSVSSDENKTATITITLPNGLSTSIDVTVGHKYDKVIYTYAATCTHAGEEQRECTVPNCPDLRENFDLPIKDHSFVNGEIVPPTCTTSGYTSQTCSVCGFVNKTNVTEPTEHQFVSKTTTGCGDVTLTVKTCSVCKYSVTEGDINAAEHEWKSAPEVDVPATCALPGQQSIHCANCSATKDVETISVTGQHDFTDKAAFFIARNISIAKYKAASALTLKISGKRISRSAGV